MKDPLSKLIDLVSDGPAVKARLEELRDVKEKADQALAGLRSKESDANARIQEADAIMADAVALQKTAEEQAQAARAANDEIEAKRAAVMGEIEAIEKALPAKRDEIRARASEVSKFEARAANLASAIETRSRELQRINDTIHQKQALLQQLVTG